MSAPGDCADATGEEIDEAWFALRRKDLQRLYRSGKEYERSNRPNKA